MPILIMGLFIATIDRINISFASLQMNLDLGFSSAVFGMGAGLFFIGYFLFEVPSNLLLERTGPRIWLARIMVTWGIIVVLMAFMVTSASSFYILRFILGAAEAGFYPGVILYLTYWFKKKDRATVIGTFLIGSYLGGLLGAPLFGLLLEMDGILQLKGWQWLFILTGIPAVLMAFVILKFLTDRPENAKWLTDEEKQWLIAELKKESEMNNSSQTKQGGFWKVLTSPVIILLAVIHILYVTLNLGLQLWLPQFIQGNGDNLSNISISLLTMLPYAAAIVGLLYWGRRSDKFQERRWHATSAVILASVGLIIAANANSLFVAILAVVITSLGFGAFQPIFWAIASNTMTAAQAAAGIAIVNSVGSLGGFVGPYVMGWTKDLSGGYYTGLIIWSLCGFTAAILLQLIFKKKRKATPNPALNVNQ